MLGCVNGSIHYGSGIDSNELAWRKVVIEVVHSVARCIMITDTDTHTQRVRSLWNLYKLQVMSMKWCRLVDKYSTGGVEIKPSIIFWIIHETLDSCVTSNNVHKRSSIMHAFKPTNTPSLTVSNRQPVLISSIQVLWQESSGPTRKEKKRRKERRSYDMCHDGEEGSSHLHSKYFLPS